MRRQALFNGGSVIYKSGSDMSRRLKSHVIGFTRSWSLDTSSAARGGDAKRRAAAWFAALILGLSGSFVFAQPAMASSFPISVSYSHAGGALAVKVTTSGNFLERSVSVAGPHGYCIANHQCEILFAAYADPELNNLLDSKTFLMDTRGKGSTDYFFNGFTLDGSCCRGGIGAVVVYAIDITHNANTGTEYGRR
ncbi:hypothetical protein ACPCHT_05525 [Nucisporomicrobium flavum]|uniref:hypothetical protein n=1 Tax=Nucisporomicrobium flavum TaxID=2785915 RepID=UPI003C2F928F